MTLPNWRTEVDQLHRFFQALFLAEIDSIDRADTAFGSDFSFVGPDGARSGRDVVLAQLEAGRGHSSHLRIEIEGHRTIVETDSLIVAEYIEVHHLAEGGNRRRSTVVFDIDPTGPNGVRWRHVHETFLPPTDEP